MTKREFELVLLKSGSQEQGTRTAYLRQKAKEAGIDEMVFFDGLMGAYQRWYDYIQHPDTVVSSNGTVMYAEIEVHEDGTRTPAKRSINLLGQYPGEGITGHLTIDHLAELNRVLVEYGASISAPDHQGEAPDRHKQNRSFIDHLVMDELKKQPFADELKRLFPGIKGADLGIILAAMEEEGMIILSNKAEIYRSLQEFFGWEIGNHTGINRALRSLDTKDKQLLSYRGQMQRIYQSII